MNCEVLNITNGDMFNDYFISKFGGIAVPFREAMMDGGTTVEIFSDKFVSIRSSLHNVTSAEYKENMLACDALNEHRYAEVDLWFGKDTFCQINLLTLLAYLEQICYDGIVRLNYIDDETFEVIEENINVRLGEYKPIYETVLVHRRKPSCTGVLIYDAIDKYFDYHSDSGALAMAVRNNWDKDDMAIICILLEMSKEYGLSDIQAQKLVEKYKQKRN